MSQVKEQSKNPEKQELPCPPVLALELVNLIPPSLYAAGTFQADAPGWSLE